MRLTLPPASRFHLSMSIISGTVCSFQPHTTFVQCLAGTHLGPVNRCTLVSEALHCWPVAFDPQRAALHLCLPGSVVVLVPDRPKRGAFTSFPIAWVPFIQYHTMQNMLLAASPRADDIMTSRAVASITICTRIFV